VNEDDHKLNTLTLKEEDQRFILIIGGIRIFLRVSPVEVSAYVASEIEEETKPIETVGEEANEWIHKSSPRGDKGK
jgi:hypothetical protein